MVIFIRLIRIYPFLTTVNRFPNAQNFTCFRTRTARSPHTVVVSTFWPYWNREAVDRTRRVPTTITVKQQWQYNKYNGWKFNKFVQCSVSKMSESFVVCTRGNNFKIDRLFLRSCAVKKGFRIN